ncbi:hypothetical protein AAE478_005034 [Parahypoxylon ruwenzoriense]
MEYAWESIIISCFIILGALIAILLKNSMRPPRVPKSIQQALTQLETVSEKRSCRNPQTESEEAECPICLSHLYVRAAPAPAAPAAGDEEDLEAGGVLRPTTTTTTTTTADGPAEAKPNQPTQPINDDVLKLKRCSHVFHARCLATWYLRKKYRCPVCRAPYYQLTDRTGSGEDYRRRTTLPSISFW